MLAGIQRSPLIYSWLFLLSLAISDKQVEETLWRESLNKSFSITSSYLTSKNQWLWKQHGWTIHYQFLKIFAIDDTSDVWVMMIMVAEVTFQGLIVHLSWNHWRFSWTNTPYTTMWLKKLRRIGVFAFVQVTFFLVWNTREKTLKKTKVYGSTFESSLPWQGSHASENLKKLVTLHI